MSFERMAIGLLFVAFIFRALLIPAQDDTFWTLRAGADIWRTGHVPLVDSYSFTAAGAPWPDHEWLWQAFAYGCHRLGGMALVTLAGALLILAAVWLVHRLMVGPPLTRFVLMTVGIGLGSCVWSLRPHLVTLLAVVVLVSLLARERFWPIPLLFLGWANAHGGVSLGGLVLLAATAAAALRFWRYRAPEDRRRLLALGVVLPLAGLATCATPLGTGIFRFVWASTTRLHAAGITEWEPTRPTTLVGALFCTGAVAFLALLAWRRRALAAGPWSDWALVAGALALLPPALGALRSYAPFAMLATPAASRLLGAEFRFRIPGRRAARSPSPDHPRLNLALFSLFSAAVAAIVAVGYALPHAWLNWRPIGDGALAAVRACDGPLYNHYNDGGQLIWFAPEKPVFIDSRQDPYPLPFLLDFIAVEHGERPYRPMFDRWGIRCAFLSTNSPTVAALGADGWATRFRDRHWVVLAAPTSAGVARTRASP